eukprot:COSAG02_NODE_7130_length_3166_cov_9.166309_6_plen_56_part_00
MQGFSKLQQCMLVPVVAMSGGMTIGMCSCECICLQRMFAGFGFLQCNVECKSPQL